MCRSIENSRKNSERAHVLLHVNTDTFQIIYLFFSYLTISDKTYNFLSLLYSWGKCDEFQSTWSLLFDRFVENNVENKNLSTGISWLTIRSNVLNYNVPKFYFRYVIIYIYTLNKFIHFHENPSVDEVFFGHFFILKTAQIFSHVQWTSTVKILIFT